MDNSKLATATILSIVACTSAYYYISGLKNKITDLQDEKISLQDEVMKQKKLREDERHSRIALQKNQRVSIQTALQEGGYTYQAIGHIESPFVEKRGTPRQPLLVPSCVGMIKFNKKLIQFQHYEELKQFSHVWVIFVFSENTDIDKSGNGSKVAKIRPPRLHGEKVGCLSTRSPHRPNNIGLSVCEVVEVTSEGIMIKCIDMVDQTPVLDVKPYIPYDIVPSDYVLSMATTSIGEPLEHRKLTVPSWIVDSDITLRPVEIAANTIEIIETIAREKRFRNYTSAESIIELIKQVLRQDIRGYHQGRGQVTKSSDNTQQQQQQVYHCTLDCLKLSFVTQEDAINVNHIEVV